MLVGAVERLAPEFLEQDVEDLLQQMRIKADRGPHGHPMSEATDTAADPSENGPYRYVAGIPITDPDTGAVIYAPAIDWARKAQEDAEDAWRRAAGKDVALPNGAFFPVWRVDRSSPKG